MGLDTYASRSDSEINLTKEDIKAFDEANITLCGGLFSGNDGSFRGKVYARTIYEITGEDLYQVWITPVTVRKMYDALAKFDPEMGLTSWRYMNTPEEIRSLCKFFKICSERGLGLIGWS
jgi:hypothetical protein